MSLERAMENAIVSTEMEGFVVTREQRELMVRVLKKEITLEEAISMLSKKYKWIGLRQLLVESDMQFIYKINVRSLTRPDAIDHTRF